MSFLQKRNTSAILDSCLALGPYSFEFRFKVNVLHSWLNKVIFLGDSGNIDGKLWIKLYSATAKIHQRYWLYLENRFHSGWAVIFSSIRIMLTFCMLFNSQPRQHIGYFTRPFKVWAFRTLLSQKCSHYSFFSNDIISFI